VDESRRKWQKHWKHTPNAALTKQFYPSIWDRLKSKIKVTSNFSAIVSGHGKTRSYLHHFKLMEIAACPCRNGDQTSDHLLYQCTLLKHQREILKKGYTKSRNLANIYDIIRMRDCMCECWKFDIIEMRGVILLNAFYMI
jgi:hypothetical protein